MTTQTKYAAMAATLAALGAALQGKADVYGTLNSQDADYRALQQQIAVTLALPEDKPTEAAPAAPAIVQTFMDADQVDAHMVGLLAALHDTRDEIIHALQPAADPAVPAQ